METHKVSPVSHLSTLTPASTHGPVSAALSSGASYVDHRRVAVAFSALRGYKLPRGRAAFFGGVSIVRRASTPSAKSLYSVHPGVAMVQDWIANLKPKTGRSLDEWIRFVKASGPPTEKERRDWLKKEHGLGTNIAWWLAERAEGKGGEDADPDAYLKAAAGYVEAMYAGPKALLRPIHDRLIAIARKLGKEVKVCPCTTMVPLYRNHVFAEIKPSTRTRIDLGFALAKSKGKLPKRLIDTGGLEKKDRITHRIPITTLEDTDDEVERWLRVAYDLDG